MGGERGGCGVCAEHRAEPGVSLVGYRAQNHPQQVLAVGPRADVDERATPPELFAAFDQRFAFTVDAAALAYNAKLPRYWTPDDDGLAQDWTGERVWCNPPFSNLEPWVRKASASGADLVVMLAPANRTQLGWWQEVIEPRRDRGEGLSVEFLRGRIRFGFGNVAPLPNTRPPFGCCLLIWETPRTAVDVGPGAGGVTDRNEPDPGRRLLRGPVPRQQADAALSVGHAAVRLCGRP